MKKVLLAVLVVFPCIAFAEVPVSAGNVKQESCGFPDQQMVTSWKLESASFTKVATLKNKLNPVGKVISVGDALFYANIVIVPERKNVFYKANSNIEIKGDSWANMDYAVRSGETFSTSYGTLSSIDNKNKYQVFPLKITDGYTYILALKDDGFFCSGLIALNQKDGYFISKSYTVYQKEPLVKQEEQSVHDTLHNTDDAIALTLVNMADISATLGVKLLAGGKVIQQKEIQLDAMSGTFAVGGLVISFEKNGKSSIKITAIKEPENYVNWHNYIKSTVLGIMH